MTPADLSPEGLAALGRAIREDGWAGPGMCDPDQPAAWEGGDDEA